MSISIPNNLDNTTTNATTNYNIYDFLEEHRVEKGQSYTHTAMGLGKYAGSFYIRPSE